MNKQMLSATAVTERKSEEAPKTAYSAPRMFAVGNTVELIQGSSYQGYKDGAYSSWRHPE